MRCGLLRSSSRRPTLPRMTVRDSSYKYVFYCGFWGFSPGGRELVFAGR